MCKEWQPAEWFREWQAAIMQLIKMANDVPQWKGIIPADSLGMRWSDGPVFGLDSETTGPNPLRDRLVSAAIVLDVPGEENQIFSWLADPGIPVELEATAVHGISTEMAQAKGESTVRVITSILERMNDIKAAYGRIPLIVVNAVFDLTILNREIKRLKIDSCLSLDFPVIDTLVCDRSLDPWRSGRRTLTATMAAYGMAMRNSHQAEGDVKASIRLARAMAEKYPEFGSADLRRLQGMQRQAAQLRAEQFQAYRRSDGIEPDFTVDPSWPLIP
jgi:DNA polymerase-3 subunit epsilon